MSHSRNYVVLASSGDSQENNSQQEFTTTVVRQLLVQKPWNNQILFAIRRQSSLYDNFSCEVPLGSPSHLAPGAVYPTSLSISHRPMLLLNPFVPVASPKVFGFCTKTGGPEMSNIGQGIMDIPMQVTISKDLLCSAQGWFPAI